MVGIQAGGREKEEEGEEEDLKQGFSKPIRDIKAWWRFIYVTADADADFFVALRSARLSTTLTRRL